MMQLTLAIQVKEGTMTSSPGPACAATRAEFSATCPDETGRAYATCIFSANASENSSQLGASPRSHIGDRICGPDCGSVVTAFSPPSRANLLICNSCV